MTRLRPCPAILLTVLVAASGVSARGDDVSAPHRRKPAAGVLLDGGRMLAVANEACGTISLIDLNAGSVKAEVPIGQKLTNLVAVPGSEWLLATDFGAGELVAVRNADGKLSRETAVSVSPYPISVSVSADGRSASVASMWSRKLTFVELDAAQGALKIVEEGQVDLPFPPRLQQRLPDGKHLVVGDAFGGNVAVVDLESRVIESVRQLPASNLRGFALSNDGKFLAVSHQMTNHLATTSGDDIHWGMLVQNLIRLVDVNALLDPEANLHRRSEMGHISQPGAGEADPAGLVQIGDDEWLVAISGSNEALLTSSSAGIHSRVPTGARPVAVLLDPINKLGYTINQLSDSITVIDTNEGTVIRSVSLGLTPEPTAITRGERLFYNGGLSHDRWLSCHSCHPDGHTTGQLVDTKSDGTYGTPKRIITLLGTRDANPWAWNGEFRELHGQVRKSIATSMQGRNPSSEQVNDIVTFLHTLEPAPPLKTPRTEAEKATVTHGREVFTSLGCAKCHVPSLTYTSNEVYDVGLEDEAGGRKFNPPFLRGVSQRDSLFHDGRAKSLREALVDLSHQISEPVAESDMDALLEFLKTL